MKRSIAIAAIVALGLAACGNPSGPPPEGKAAQGTESTVAITTPAPEELQPTVPDGQAAQVGVTLADLVQRADYICVARVRSVAARREWYDPQIEMVMSRVRLKVLENLKGRLPDGTEIRSFGGFLDGFPYFDFDGIFPQFAEGEEVVLFLGNFFGGIFPVEHALGKWTIEDGRITATGQPVQEVKDAIHDLLR